MRGGEAEGMSETNLYRLAEGECVGRVRGSGMQGRRVQSTGCSKGGRAMVWWRVVQVPEASS